MIEYIVWMGIIGWPSAFAEGNQSDVLIFAGIATTDVVIGDSIISLAADRVFEETTLF